MFELFSKEDDVYPVTIMTARYGGTYEGSPWLALNLHPHELPADATDSDIECMWFWQEYRENNPVGYGVTPQDAYADLKEKLKENPEQDYFTRVRGW